MATAASGNAWPAAAALVTVYPGAHRDRRRDSDCTVVTRPGRPRSRQTQAIANLKYAAAAAPAVSTT